VSPKLQFRSNVNFFQRSRSAPAGRNTAPRFMKNLALNHKITRQIAFVTGASDRPSALRAVYAIQHLAA
jgi:hypothetical protein